MRERWEWHPVRLWIMFGSLTAALAMVVYGLSLWWTLIPAGVFSAAVLTNRAKTFSPVEEDSGDARPG